MWRDGTVSESELIQWTIVVLALFALILAIHDAILARMYKAWIIGGRGSHFAAPAAGATFPSTHTWHRRVRIRRGEKGAPGRAGDSVVTQRLQINALISVGTDPPLESDPLSQNGSALVLLERHGSQIMSADAQTELLLATAEDLSILFITYQFQNGQTIPSSWFPNAAQLTTGTANVLVTDNTVNTDLPITLSDIAATSAYTYPATVVVTPTMIQVFLSGGSIVVAPNQYVWLLSWTVPWFIS